MCFVKASSKAQNDVSFSNDCAMSIQAIKLVDGSATERGRSLKLSALLNAQAILKKAKFDKSPTIVDPCIDEGELVDPRMSIEGNM